MRILFASAWCPPYHLGGTEVYLAGLAEELALRGVDCIALTPQPPGAPERYTHGAMRVETYPVDAAPTRKDIRSDAPHRGFDRFRALLQEHRGAIYHQQSWTRGCGPNHLRMAREAGFRTLATVHVAGNFCLRGTMLRFGRAPCEGPVGAQLCGACWAHANGASECVARLIASAPRRWSETALRIDARIATMFGAHALGARKLAALHEMAGNAEFVVAVCRWLYDALRANGVPEEKLVLSRQGVGRDFAVAPRRDRSGAMNASLRLAYFGRWDAVKGVDFAIDAMRALPADCPASLTIHAIAGDAAALRYEEELRRRAALDPRIVVASAVARNALVQTMAQYDALVIPSLWLETGPIVALEARALGLFILGSRRGGLTELITEGVDGELLDPSDVMAWTTAIARLAKRRQSGATLAPRVVDRARTMADVADEMLALYRSCKARR
jgi:glycosyltransferase involved in cell wall biosynthesis